jgi:hypothetical protein
MCIIRVVTLAAIGLLEKHAMTCPEDPPPPPSSLPLVAPIPWPETGPLLPTVGVPLPPLDESHWRFVFQDDPDEE